MTFVKRCLCKPWSLCQVRGTYTYTGVMALMLFLMLMLLAIGQRSETFKKSRDPPLLTLPAPDDALVALR